jgi:hypothetical protein
MGAETHRNLAKYRRLGANSYVRWKMARTIWNHGAWLRKLVWHLRDAAHSVSLEHVLYPESYFREKLVQERKRASRSNKAMLVMIVDAENLRKLEKDGQIGDELVEEVNACVRVTDICGFLKEGVLVGVILTEVEPEKIEVAQQMVAKKTREKLAALVGGEAAQQIAITFHVFTAAGNNDPILDMALKPDITVQAGATGWDLLTTAKEGDRGGSADGEGQDSGIGMNQP